MKREDDFLQKQQVDDKRTSDRWDKDKLHDEQPVQDQPDRYRDINPRPSDKD